VSLSYSITKKAAKPRWPRLGELRIGIDPSGPRRKFRFRCPNYCFFCCTTGVTRGLRFPVSSMAMSPPFQACGEPDVLHSFCGFAFVKASSVQYSRWATRLPYLDLSWPLRRKKYDKRGGRILIRDPRGLFIGFSDDCRLKVVVRSASPSSSSTSTSTSSSSSSSLVSWRNRVAHDGDDAPVDQPSGNVFGDARGHLGSFWTSRRSRTDISGWPRRD
jgi:hypothetical protein